MLQFHGRRPTRNYLARREQWRLLTLFGMLGLVLVLMRFAGREQSWTWLFGEEAAGPPSQAPTEPVDSVLSSAPATDVPDAVRMQRLSSNKAVTPKHLLPGLPRELFASVVDNTVLRGGDEHEAFFQTLSVLSKTDEQDASLPQPLDVSFVQLHRQPESYRGEWVRVRGIARGAFPVLYPMNTYDVSSLYQLWLQPEGRPDDLLAVNLLQLPPGFPQGKKVQAEVTIDGVFFKRWAYQAQDRKIRTAPLLLARTVVWTPPAPTGISAPAEFSPLDMALAASAVALVIGAVVFIVRGGQGTGVSANTPAPDFHQLAEQDAGNDVARMLSNLRERELADEAPPSPSAENAS
ncbi:MAG: hypothetical protein SGJ19_05405 [Planctomycetia bacterium]|nr:hypothetical protein [Planctomycetia bacterium]